jgi:hypothetical protein
LIQCDHLVSFEFRIIMVRIEFFKPIHEFLVVDAFLLELYFPLPFGVYFFHNDHMIINCKLLIGVKQCWKIKQWVNLHIPWLIIGLCLITNFKLPPIGSFFNSSKSYQL